jgi:hypothetical protein
VDLLDPFELRPGDDRDDVVLTLTRRPSELTGVVIDGAGAPVVDFSVLVFPADRAQWVHPSRRIRQTRPGTDGGYNIRGLPPGDYFMALLNEIDEVDLGDAAFLEELSAASVRVSLVEGQTTRQDVRIR